MVIGSASVLFVVLVHGLLLNLMAVLHEGVCK